LLAEKQTKQRRYSRAAFDQFPRKNSGNFEQQIFNEDDLVAEELARLAVKSMTGAVCRREKT